MHYNNGRNSQNPCRRCENPWAPGHKCCENYLPDNVRKRIEKGGRHVHIISDFVQALENNETTNELQHGEEEISTGTHLSDFDNLMN